MPATVTRLLLLAAVGAFLPAAAHAQPLGTFQWRMEPYCDVLTLDVIREGRMLRLHGTDNWCGAHVAPLPVSGTAVVDGDGRVVYMGLSVTPFSIGFNNQPETEGMFISVTLDLATASGVWRDNRGDSGAFVPSPQPTANSPRLLGHSTRLHTTFAENTTGNRTCLFITDPDAKLLVEYNRRSNTSIGPNLNSTVSVYYADEGTGLANPLLENGVWCIQLNNGAAMPLNATFTVQVVP